MSNLSCKVNLLFSYAFLKTKSLYNLVLRLSDSTDILIDSGAHSAFSKGVKIDLNEYIEFCHGVKDKVWQYIQLDKIGSPKTTKDNLEAMVSNGLKPMPVFVVGEQFKEAERLVQVNPYICVAGGVGSPDKYIWRRYQQVYEASGKQALIHGLGFLRMPSFLQLPLYSGDSSSMSGGSRWGIFYTYDQKQGFIQKRYRNLVQQNSGDVPVNFREFMGLCGIKTEDVFTDQISRGSDSFITFSSIHAFLKALYHSNRFGKKIFLVIVSSTHVVSLMALMKHMKYDYFPYWQVRDTFQHYKELWKTDKDACLKDMCDILEKGIVWH